MADALSLTSAGRASFNIPKIKKTEYKDSIQQVNLNNRDVQNLLRDINKNCLDINFSKEIDVLQVSMVHSADVLSRYVQKRTEMKDAGRNLQTLNDQLGFLVTRSSEKLKIAKEGLYAKPQMFNRLGNGDCGVYLTRFFDVEVKCAWLSGPQIVEVFVFKYFTGKCKSLNIGNIYEEASSDIEPTPNYDSHIGSTPPNLSDRLFTQMARSRIYLYEYTDECVPSKFPRHCLPFAVIKLRKRKQPEESMRRVNIPRDISSGIEATVSQPLCDKPVILAENSRTKLSATTSVHTTVTSSLPSSKSLDTSRYSSTESVAKDSVITSSRRYATDLHRESQRTQAAGSSENQNKVDRNGVKNICQQKNDKLETRLSHDSMVDKKVKLPAAGTKPALSELQNQYMKRFAAANEKIQAEKNCKMSEFLKYIPQATSQQPVISNNSSTSYVAKASGLAVKNTECQNSKLMSGGLHATSHTEKSESKINIGHRRILLPVPGHASTSYHKESEPKTHSDSRGHNLFAGVSAPKLANARYASAVQEASQSCDILDTNIFNLPSHKIDPRLLKRSHSSNTGTAPANSTALTHCPSSFNSTVAAKGRVGYIKPALKISDCQKPVKRKMSYSEYKKLRTREQTSVSISNTLLTNEALLHEKLAPESTLCSLAISTKVDHSQNSVSVNTNLENVQKVTQLPESETYTLGDKTSSSHAHKASSALLGEDKTLELLKSVQNKLTCMISTDSRKLDCESNLTVRNGHPAEIPSHEEISRVTLPPLNGTVSNVLTECVGKAFTEVGLSPTVIPNPNRNFFVSSEKCIGELGSVQKRTDSPFVPNTATSLEDPETEAPQEKQSREIVNCRSQISTTGPGVDGKAILEQSELNDSTSDLKQKYLSEKETMKLTSDSREGAQADADTNCNIKTCNHHPPHGSCDEPASHCLVQSSGLKSLSVRSVVEASSCNRVTLEVKDRDKPVPSYFAPIHPAISCMDHHNILTPTLLRHDSVLSLKDDDSQSSQVVLNSLEEVEQGQLNSDLGSSEDDLFSQQVKLYGEKPLPKSISMRDVGIECWLLALGDMKYQPFTIVVDYNQVKYKNDCKVCTTSPKELGLQEKDMTQMKSLIGTENHTSILTSLSNITAEVRSGASDKSCSTSSTSSVKDLLETSPSEADVLNNLDTIPTENSPTDALVAAAELEIEQTQSPRPNLFRLDASPDVEMMCSVAMSSSPIYSETLVKTKSANFSMAHTNDTNIMLAQKYFSLNSTASADKGKTKCNVTVWKSNLTSSENLNAKAEDKLSDSVLPATEFVKDGKHNCNEPDDAAEIDLKAPNKTSTVQPHASGSESTIDISDEEIFRENLLEETYRQKEASTRMAVSSSFEAETASRTERVKEAFVAQKDIKEADEENMKKPAARKIFSGNKELEQVIDLKVINSGKIVPRNRSNSRSKVHGELIPELASSQYKIQCSRSLSPSTLSIMMKKPFQATSLNALPVACRKPEDSMFAVPLAGAAAKHWHCTGSETKKVESSLQAEKNIKVTQILHNSSMCNLEQSQSVKEKCSALENLALPRSLTKEANVVLSETFSKNLAKFTSLSGPELLTPVTDTHPTHMSPQNSHSVSSLTVPNPESRAASSKQMFPPARVMESAATEKLFSDVHLACRLSTREQERKNISNSNVVSAVTVKTSNMARCLPDKGLSKILKDLSTSSTCDAIYPSVEVIDNQKSISEESSKCSAGVQEISAEDQQSKPNNSCYLVKLFLDKVKEGTEVKKHIDEELLAFQQEINCLDIETQQNSQSETLNERVEALQDIRAGLVKNTSDPSCKNDCSKTVGSCTNILSAANHDGRLKPTTFKNNNRECWVQYKAAIKAMTERKENIMLADNSCVTSTSAQNRIDNCFAPSAGAAAKSDPLTFMRSAKAMSSSDLNPPSVSGRVGDQAFECESISAQNMQDATPFDSISNHVAQRDLSVTMVESQLQQPYRDEDFRTDISEPQCLPVYNWGYSSQQHVSQNHVVPGPVLWEIEGAQNSNSIISYPIPVNIQTHYQCFPQQSWMETQRRGVPVQVANLVQVPALGTFGDSDYRQFPQAAHMPISAEAALAGVYDRHSESLRMGSFENDTAFQDDMTADELEWPAINFSASRYYTDVANIQKDFDSLYNQNSSFWMSSNTSDTSNISGLGFSASGTELSGIPGLDTVIQNQNGSEKSEQKSESTISSDNKNSYSVAASEASKENQDTPNFDPKSVWPELYDASHSTHTTSLEIKCRNILKSLNSNPTNEEKNTETKTCKVIEEEYSDDDQTDLPVQVSQPEQDTDISQSKSPRDLTSTERSASVHQYAEASSSNKSQDELEKEESSKIADLLFIHLSNAIKKAASAPKLESNGKNPLPVLMLLRETLARRKSQESEEQMHSYETEKQLESDLSVRDTICKPRTSASEKLDTSERPEFFGSHKDIETKVGSLTEPHSSAAALWPRNMSCSESVLKGNSSDVDIPKSESPELRNSKVSSRSRSKETIMIRTSRSSSSVSSHSATTSPKKHAMSPRKSSDGSCKFSHFRLKPPASRSSSSSESETLESSNESVSDKFHKRRKVSANYRIRFSNSRSRSVMKNCKVTCSNSEQLLHSSKLSYSSPDTKSLTPRKGNFLPQRRQVDLPKKYDSSPGIVRQNILSRINRVTRKSAGRINFSTTSYDQSNNSLDRKKRSQCFLRDKQSKDKFREHSESDPVINDKIIPVKTEREATSACLPCHTEGNDAVENTTITVSSDGKVYLADVPLSALSYAREKILSEINKLNKGNSTDLAAESQIVGLPESSKQSATSADTGKSRHIIPSKWHKNHVMAAKDKEVEDGEVGSDSDNDVLLISYRGTSENKNNLSGKRKNRRKKHKSPEKKSASRSAAYKHRLIMVEEKKIVKHNSSNMLGSGASADLKNSKASFKTDTGNLKNAQLADPCVKTARPKTDMAVYISTDSDTDHSIYHTRKKEKTSCDKIKKSLGSLSTKTSAIDSSDTLNSLAFKAHGNGEAVISSSRVHEKSKHDNVVQKRTSEKGYYSSKEEEIISSDDTLQNDKISGNDPESVITAEISVTVSQTSLKKPSLVSSPKKVFQTSSKHEAVENNMQEEIGKVKKCSLAGRSITITVVNKESLLLKDDREDTDEKMPDRIITLHCAGSDVLSSVGSTSKISKMSLSDDTVETSGKNSHKGAAQGNTVNKNSPIVTGDNSLSITHDNNSAVVEVNKKAMKSQKKALKPANASQVKADLLKWKSRDLLSGSSLTLNKAPDDVVTVKDQILMQTSVTSNITKKLCVAVGEEGEGNENKTSEESQSKNIEDKKDLLYSKVVKKSKQSNKPGATKRANKNRSMQSATEAERHNTDYNSDKDVHRKSLSPISGEAKRRRTDSRDNRRRRSSSVSSFSRDRSSSSRSRNSRSSSSFSRDSRSHSRKRYSRDRRPSSSSSSTHYRRRRSRSISSSPNFKRRRQLPFNHRRRDTYRYRRSVSSSRSRGSSTSNSRHRNRSRSPYRSGGNYSFSSGRHGRLSQKKACTELDYYSSKTKDDRLLTMVTKTSDFQKSRTQHPIDLFYSVTNISVQEHGSVTGSLANISAQKNTSGTVSLSNTDTQLQTSNPVSHSDMNTQLQTSNPGSLTVTSSQKHTSSTASIPADKTKKEDTPVPTNSKTISSCLQTTEQPNVGPKVTGTNTAIGGECSMMMSQSQDKIEMVARNFVPTKEAPIEMVARNFVPTKEAPIDYTTMLFQHKLAQSVPVHPEYNKTHNVTVKELIMAQLGISFIKDVLHSLPYSLNTVLSNPVFSQHERNSRAMESILCCTRHVNIPDSLVLSCSIEPVINTFGNLPFENRLEHFSDEQILLEVNVIKQCQNNLEYQQRQETLCASSLDRLTRRKMELLANINEATSLEATNPDTVSAEMLATFQSELLAVTQEENNLTGNCGAYEENAFYETQYNESMFFDPGTYAGEALPQDLQVPVHGFTFIIPYGAMPEEEALNLKVSLEVTVDCLLELVNCYNFGREHFRVPELLLLEEEKYQLYSRGNCFLILNKSLPKKVFVRLLTLKNKIEALRRDKDKSMEEKYFSGRQLIGERTSLLMSHIGNITYKRVSKMKTLHNQLLDCQTYMRSVTGTEGLRKMKVFDAYLLAVRNHLQILNEEVRHPRFPDYDD